MLASQRGRAKAACRSSYLPVGLKLNALEGTGEKFELLSVMQPRRLKLGDKITSATPRPVSCVSNFDPTYRGEGRATLMLKWTRPTRAHPVDAGRPVAEFEREEELP